MWCACSAFWVAKESSTLARKLVSESARSSLYKCMRGRDDGKKSSEVRRMHRRHCFVVCARVRASASARCLHSLVALHGLADLCLRQQPVRASGLLQGECTSAGVVVWLAMPGQHPAK